MMTVHVPQLQCNADNCNASAETSQGTAGEDATDLRAIHCISVG